VYSVKSQSDVSEEYIASIFRIEEYAKPDDSTLQADHLLGLFFGPDDGGDMFLRNVG
jgi:hypothetical protein